MSSERLERVEERVAWLERHVTAQDKAMLELHEEIARLRRELVHLRPKLEAGQDASGANLAEDERPPHY